MNIGIRLQRLNNEDMIWVIYLFIAIAAIISDKFERDFILSKNTIAHKKFRTINIVVLTVALFIYIYFVFLNYEDVATLKKEVTKKEVILTHASLVAALLFLIGGIITLFVEINRANIIDEEVGL